MPSLQSGGPGVSRAWTGWSKSFGSLRCESRVEAYLRYPSVKYLGGVTAEAVEDAICQIDHGMGHPRSMDRVSADGTAEPLSSPTLRVEVDGPNGLGHG